MRRRGHVILIGLLALVAGWLLSRGGDAPIPQGMPPYGAERETAPELVGSAAREATGAGATARPSESSPAARAVEDYLRKKREADGQPTVHLRVTLKGWDPEVKGVARIRIAPGFRDGPRSCTVPEVEAHEAVITTDVTRVLRPEDVGRLQVAVDHPAYLPATGSVPVPEGLEEGAVLDVEVRLVRATVVAGSVVAPDGAAIEGAAVAIHIAGPNGPVIPAQKRFVDSSIETAKTGPDGAFQLRVRDAGRYFLTVGADGRLPATAYVDVEAGRVVQVAEFVLAAGVAIEGRVRISGTPAAEAWVDASIRQYALTYRVAGYSPSIAWQDGVAVPTARFARTDSEGRFRLTGLAPSSYLVTVSSAGSDWDPACAAGSERAVAAPASNVSMDLRGVEVVFVVEADGEALTWSDVRLEAGGVTLHASGSDGRASILLLPERRYRLSVVYGGYEDYEADFVAPAAGPAKEQTIRLVRRPVGASLDVGLRDTEGKEVTQAAFMLRRNDGSVTQYVSLGLFEGMETRRYVWPDIEAGTWMLTVLPGRHDPERGGTFLPIEQEVEIPQGGSLRLDLVAHHGGLLQVAARSQNGSFVGARCTIRNAGGQAQSVTFTNFGPGYASLGGHALGADSPSTTEQALPPGRYEVEISGKGFAPRRETVVLEPGKTTVLRVTLEP